MQPITAPIPGMSVRGRWIWRLLGVVTLVALAIFGTWVIFRAARPSQAEVAQTALPSRTVTITAPVSALNVNSYGQPVRVTVTPGPVRVTESVVYGSGAARPTVSSTVSHGLLTLADPACAQSDCSVAFSVTVPKAVAVTASTAGGNVTLDGTGAANVDSGGGQVYAAGLTGSLTAHSEGGGVTVTKASGSVSVESGGAQVTATDIGGGLTVNTDGGQVTVAGAPAAALDSGGGPVDASGIGGPLTVASEGGGVTVTGVSATEVNSGGGPVTATTVKGSLRVLAEGGTVEAQGVTGALTADSGGAPLTATGLGGPSANVSAEGGDITLGFAAAPQAVQVDTGGGNATLSVPGGPYQVSTGGDSRPGGQVMIGGGPGKGTLTYDGGGNVTVTVPVSSTASRSISVTTEGGDLQVGPA